jgi:hypothetical protein
MDAVQLVCSVPLVRPVNYFFTGRVMSIFATKLFCRRQSEIQAFKIKRLVLLSLISTAISCGLVSGQVRAQGESSPPGPAANTDDVASKAKGITASSSQGVSLTVYNQNFGLVKDVRSVNLNKGINYLRFEDVAAAIDPTTVNFMSLTAPNMVVVREQNYQYDIMSPETILTKSVGKNILFRQHLDGGRINEFNGTLLNSPRVTIVDTNGNESERRQGLVVQTDRGVVLNPSGEMEIAKLPPGLVSKPSLLWKLETEKPGEHKTEISYQTKGLNWRSDYVAIANEDDTAADLASWVTLDNKSGASYPRSSLKLMAGDVHQVQNAQPMDRMYMATAESAPMAPRPQFSEKAFAEYHLYSLAGTTDINDNETKQLSLFNASGVPTKKLFIYEPNQQPTYYGGWSSQANPQKVNVKIEVENSEKNNLGMALPKGKVRVYKRDHDGALQFIGEDLIDHTPRDEKIRLYIGDAFDLVGERKQLNHEQISPRAQRETVEISLRNHKDKKVTITAVEHAYGDWKIKTSNLKFVKKDSHTFEFEAEVQPRGEVKITYEIETRY